MSSNPRICLITSQSGAYYDLTWKRSKGRPVFTKDKFGTIGTYCEDSNLEIPKQQDSAFSKWEGELKNLLAGPIIEVTNLFNNLETMGCEVNYWCLTFESVWKEMSEISHPIWSNSDLWKSEPPSQKMEKDITNAEWVLSTVPKNVLESNSELMDLLSQVENLILCCGTIDNFSLRTQGLDIRIKTKGLARIGKEGSKQIYSIILNKSINKV